MSVAQVKKRFGEFEAYLRKDSEGLRRLKLLKDDVNVLRTSLASAVEAKETADAIKDSARQRADSAEARALNAERECERLTQIVTNLRNALQEAENKAKECGDTDGNESATTEASEGELKAIIKKVRKTIVELPEAKDRIMIGGEPQSVFEKEQLISGWSHNSLWTLGAVVALWSYALGHIVIRSNERSKNLKISGDPDESPFGRHMVQWMNRNIDKTVHPETVLYDLTMQ